MSSEKPPLVFALVDLTRILYYGPAVAGAFLLGAVLAMPDRPLWLALAQILFVGITGFSAGFVVNDWMDWRADKVTLAARGQYPEYAAQLRRERPLTGTRPIAAGIIRPASALAFALALIAAAAAVALTLPVPHRWYVLAGLLFGNGAEALYCVIKRGQRRFPFATFLSAALVALPASVGYLAAHRPDLTALLLFASFYAWEVGFNQLHDAVDAENDRRRGIFTLSGTFGLRFVAAWCLTLSAVVTACFLAVWRTSGSGIAMLAGICAAAVLLLGTDVLFLVRPKLRMAGAAIEIHLAFVLVVVVATVMDSAARWAAA